MKASLIERYIYEVVRRLPENEREEVKAELNANIEDMLLDRPFDDEEAVREVLQELGSPAQLAEQYRQHPKYLISPATYEEYIRVLKWLVPMIGVIVMLVGFFVSTAETIAQGASSISGEAVSEIIGDGISSGVSGAFQAVFWVTIGFVIADRTGYKMGQSGTNWKVEDLPDELPHDRKRIPLSDSIVELIVILFFSALFILVCLGITPVAFSFTFNDMQITQLFSAAFLEAAVPVAVVAGGLGAIECIIKIVKRKWTPLVCLAVIVNNVVSIGLMFYLFGSTKIFSSEFTALIRSQEWGSADLLRFFSERGESSVVMIIMGIVIIAGLAESGLAVYRTFRAPESRTGSLA